MEEIECGMCGHLGTYDTKEVIHVKCSQCYCMIAVKDKEDDSMEDWEELEVGNIPSDFKDNDNYRLRVKNIGGNWIDEDITDKEDRTRVLHYIIDGDFDYQYRLKPLEPQMITKTLHDFLCIQLIKENNPLGSGSYMIDENLKGERFIRLLDGRKVEIIG